MKVKAALPAKENQQDGLTTFSKAYFLWRNFNASALLNSKYLFGVVRVLLYSIIEFLCPQKDVI